MVIAREIALDLSDASFQPNMIEHVPGIRMQQLTSCLERLIWADHFPYLLSWQLPSIQWCR
jgi:hypothetical protein